jgi:branched-chain amino acid transport system permease protein
MSLDLLFNAFLSGLLLGGFYAAVALGISIAFGMLDVPNIAHPVFVVLGSFVVYELNIRFGIDPVLAAVMVTPLFFVLGFALYSFYYSSFERAGGDPMRGLIFFFGILFIVDVALLLMFGVDHRSVETGYSETVWRWGIINVPVRLALAFGMGALLVAGAHALMGRTFFGRALQAVSQDSLGLQLMGVNPVRIKRLAFGIAIGTSALAGAALILVQPVEPSVGREFIGRAFAVCVLGGMGSLPGTVLAAIILGTAESITATFFGASWAPAVSFGILLITLAVRPSGLMGR